MFKKVVLLLLQECAVQNAKEFLSRLVSMSESELLLYDNLLVVDDVDKGSKKTTLLTLVKSSCRHPSCQI